MPNTTVDLDRRALLTGAATAVAATVVAAQTQTQTPPPAPAATRLVEVPVSPAATITVMRRDDIVLIGLNRPFIQTRLDPPTRVRLSEVMFEYEHDSSLRAAVLFGHGDNFSRGID